MRSRLPIVRDLVLVGGGHAHALLLRQWRMKPLPGARVTLVAPTALAAYSGMLPGCLAGHYTEDEIQIDLLRLARAADARLLLDRAVGLDLKRGRLKLAERPPIGFDAISINIGSVTPTPQGARSHGRLHGVKPVEPMLAGWRAYLAEDRPNPSVAVIGAGVGGVETALAAAHRLRGRGARVMLLERGDAIAPEITAGARKRLAAALHTAGVELRLGAAVARAEPGALILQDGARIEAEFVISAAGAEPHGWLAGVDLPKDQRGFLIVDQFLRSPGDPRVFAAGDAASMSASPRPKAGVFAVRQAPALTENLARALSGREPRAFTPQRDYLKLVSLGGKCAVAEKFGLSATGDWVWRWKDRIDRAFMARLSDLPDMAGETKPDGPLAQGLDAALARDPLCGACGAKLGLGALEQAFAALTPAERAVFRGGLGDDAALLTPPRRGRRVISTDHLRAFTQDAHLMARIAAIHALGDVWAMGATPEFGLLSVTLPAMSADKQAQSLREILSGTAAVFGAEEAEILGGHSSEGPETAIGFTVLGRLEDGPITQAGMEEGDALILTKPIGVGVILAAEMRGLAPGPAYQAALASMLAPSGAAARLLVEHGAHAMTDVTGFGLAGHLGRMLAASELDAELTLEQIPLLPGAEELARRGVKSSLHAANMAAGVALDGPGLDLSDPRVALLADPQTAGGLLAALPAEAAGPAIDALHEAGAVAARVIGRATRKQPGARRITLR